MKPLISKCSMIPAWHQLVPISGHVEESETARKLQLYATSIKTSVSTRLLKLFVLLSHCFAIFAHSYIHAIQKRRRKQYLDECFSLSVLTDVYLALRYGLMTVISHDQMPTSHLGIQTRWNHFINKREHLKSWRMPKFKPTHRMYHYI